MVDLRGKLYNQPLCNLKPGLHFVVIRQCLFPFFIQFRIAVLKACHNVEKFGNGLFELSEFFFTLFL